MSHSVLLVDDDKAFLEETKEALSLNGYEILTAQDGETARKIISKRHPDVALIDKKLPDVDGQDFISEAKKESKNTSFIVMTAYASLDSSINAFKEKIDDYILKPASIEFIGERINLLLKEKEEQNTILRYSESKYRRLLSLIPAVVYETSVVDNNTDNNTLYVNEKVEELFGFKQSEWLADGSLWFRQVYPADKDKAIDKFEQIKKQGKFECEYRMLHKDKETIKWIKDVGISLRGGDGKEITITGIMIDITERKLREERNEMLSCVVKDMLEGVIITDTENIIRYFNEAAVRMYGYKEEDLLGKNLSFLVSELSPNLVLQGERSSEEYMAKRRDGSAFAAHFSLFPLRDCSGKISGKVVIISDIGEKRLLEDELRRSAQKLESAIEEKTWEIKKTLAGLKEANKKLRRFDALKSEFMDYVAHEIINPLWMVQGILSSQLQSFEENASQEQKESLRVISQQIDRLLNFTENMLDISKIESGQLPIKVKEINLASIFENVKEAFKMSLEKKKIVLRIAAERPSKQIFSDEDMLIRILMNLVDNAVKYTPSGNGIEVRAYGQNGSFRIEIMNQGTFLTKEECSRIFDKFVRIFAEKERGTGLGLSLVKEMVGALSGNIWVDSEEGLGTTFTIEFPVDIRNKSKQEKQE